jgi:hypothetical protein
MGVSSGATQQSAGRREGADRNSALTDRAPIHPLLWPSKSFELDQDNLGPRAHAHGWTPRSHTAGGINHQLAETLESIGVLTKDAGGEPCEWEYLPSVSVARKLKRDTGFLGDRQSVWSMGEQDARLVVIENG